MINRAALLEGVIAALTWSFGYFLSIEISRGATSAHAYGAIVGWWLTAYISAILKISIKAAVPLSFSYMVLFVIVALKGRSWLYHDAASLSFLSMLTAGIVQAFILSSPILFDNFCRMSLAFYRRQKGETK